MNYARPPFPHALYARFNAVSKLLGHIKRGQKWHLLDLLLAYAETHPDLFRKR